MEEKILEFIKRRWSKDSHWTDGNCLWFATILKLRFPEVEIYYLPIEGHFVVGYDNQFYDWTGRLQLEEKPYLFSKLKEEDPLYYNHLIRDCFN